MKVRQFLLLILPLTLVLVSCNSREKLMNEKIRSLADMAELGTVEYTVKKIIKADDCVWYKFGDRKILFSSVAYLKAGIDLKDFSMDDVHFDLRNHTVTVTLPKAKLLAFNMPEEEINQEYCNVSGFRQSFSIQEREALKKQAEESILADVPKMGILQDAERNASDFFNAMFAGLGFRQITVNFR